MKKHRKSELFVKMILTKELINDTNLNSDLSLKYKKFKSWLPSYAQNSKILDKLINELFGLLKLVKIFFEIFQNLFSKNHDLLNFSEKFSCVFDLSRQHLPPAITLKELEDFFFDPNRPMVSNDSNCVVVISPLCKNPLRSGKIIYARNFTQLILNQENIFSALILVTKVFKVLITNRFFNFRIISDIYLALLFYYSRIYKNFNEAIITNSSWTKGPSVFYIDSKYRHYKTLMFHYSENSVPLTSGDLNFYGNPTWINNDIVDLHCVWTKTYANFLLSMNPSLKVRVCGSIVFRRKPLLNEQILQKNQILFLDREPSIFESKLGVYTENACRKFLEAVEFLYKELKVDDFNTPDFLIKPKRRDLPEYSENYLNFRQELFANGVLKKMPWETDIYNLIRESKLVVSMIGISANIIAEEFEVPLLQVYFGENHLIEPLVKYDFETIADFEILLNRVKTILGVLG
ncbi:MAG: hypothetical protein RL193_165 [Actinomycetota bacterium]|jgi:hypothetical protein